MRNYLKVLRRAASGPGGAFRSKMIHLEFFEDSSEADTMRAVRECFSAARGGAVVAAFQQTDICRSRGIKTVGDGIGRA